MKKALVVAISAILLSTINSFPTEAVSANPTPVCSAGTCTVDFTYTGDYYAWTATSPGTIKLEVWGAQGGGGVGAYMGTGGAGGYAAGNYSISTGATLYIYVGQKGWTSSTTNAFNGGGLGNPSASYGNGYSGGGASHIATTSGQLSTLSASQSSVLIVAGGGGGASGCYGGSSTCNSGWATYASNGGAGGGTSGINGVNASTRIAGTAGTASGGGTTSSASVAAAFGLGASASTSELDAIQGGGGGGGWYGGGAGSHDGGGGGGGSGYVGSLSTTTLTAGNATMPDPGGGTTTGRTGNGYARITYTPVPATLSLLLSGNPTSAIKGGMQVLTANVNYAGKATFYADGKKIAKCISVIGGPGNINCAWKPTTQKIVKITVDFLPNGESTRITTGSFTLSIVKRTNTR